VGGELLYHRPSEDIGGGFFKGEQGGGTGHHEVAGQVDIALVQRAVARGHYTSEVPLDGDTVRMGETMELDEEGEVAEDRTSLAADEDMDLIEVMGTIKAWG
jgi:hypothetical protein